MNRDNVSFILVRPLFLGNIGACARAMKNFGFGRLRLVDPPRNYKDAEARKMAVGAFDLLKRAEVFASLSEALADVSLAGGTTSGRQREVEPVAIERAAAALRLASAGNHVALVFGDERDGLTRSELDRCHHLITIPTDSRFPALNIAQAVAICAYELGRTQASAAEAAPRLPTGAEDDELFSQLELLLDRAGFSRAYNKENLKSELRSFYQRAQPTGREADLLRGALRKINQSIS